MADELAVFLENENDYSNASGVTRYALQVEKISLAILKNPIQIAAPKNSPYLFDLGTYKPTLNLSGVADDQDTDNTVTFGGDTYRTPTVHQISRLSTDWWYDTTQQINVYLQEPDIVDSGGTTRESYFKFSAALTSVSIDYKAGTEERPEFTMTFFTGRPKVYYPHMTKRT
jgi:hypothetical protein